MNKTLYLHGLNSKLYPDRRGVMESFGLDIYAPQMDYNNNPDLLTELLETYDVDLVIGSSAGGLGGYYFSGIKEVPALLFNPALPFRNYITHVTSMPLRQNFLQIVIGARDVDVPAMKTFEFLRTEFSREVPLEIHWINQMEHRFPLHIFKNELRYFLHKIKVSDV